MNPKPIKALNKSFISLTSLMFFLCSSLIALAGQGIATTNTEIKAAPDATSNTLAKIKKGDRIEVGQRQGSWYRVTHNGQQGYIRMIAIRFSEATDNKTGGSGFGDFLSSIVSGSDEPAVGTGVKGLGEEDLTRTLSPGGPGGLSFLGQGVVNEEKSLQQARQDRAAVEKMKMYSSTKSRAASFADQGGLKSRTIDYAK